jgi:hypothetical protein
MLRGIRGRPRRLGSPGRNRLTNRGIYLDDLCNPFELSLIEPHEGSGDGDNRRRADLGIQPVIEPLEGSGGYGSTSPRIAPAAGFAFQGP